MHWFFFFSFCINVFRYIGKEENEASKERREIGNVRSDHEISFEYGVRKAKPKVSKEKPSANPLDRINEVSTSMEGQWGHPHYNTCILYCPFLEANYWFKTNSTSKNIMQKMITVIPASLLSIVGTPPAPPSLSPQSFLKCYQCNHLSDKHLDKFVKPSASDLSSFMSVLITLSLFRIIVQGAPLHPIFQIIHPASQKVTALWQKVAVRPSQQPQQVAAQLMLAAAVMKVTFHQSCHSSCRSPTPTLTGRRRCESWPRRNLWLMTGA